MNTMNMILIQESFWLLVRLAYFIEILLFKEIIEHFDVAISNGVP